jgi:hypothetical protein
VSEPSAEGAWSVAEGEQPDRPILIRARTDLGVTTSAQRWPNRLAVVWTCPPDGADQRGMPTPAQQTAMGRLEDALTAGLEGKGAAVLTSVATSGGQREWVWYCGPASELNPAFNAALKGHPRYPIQLQLAPDPAWAQYRRLLAAVGAGDR